jgi:putative membrane protein
MFGRFEYRHGMGGGPGMLVGILCFLIFLALVTAVVLITIKLIRHKGHFGHATGEHMYMSDGSHGNTQLFSGKALEILNERYAKGEIEDEEYIKKKAELTKP